MPEDWFEATQNEDDTMIHDGWLVVDADDTTRWNGIGMIDNMNTF
jgi:hypothetical protein